MEYREGLPPPTAREKWIKLSTEIQKDVNAALEELQLEIEMANMNLLALSITDIAAAREYAVEVVQYLDSMWGYEDDLFVVTGTWHEPVFAIEEQGIRTDHIEKEACHKAQSNGFIVKWIDDGEGGQVPRVGLSFIAGTITYVSPYMQTELQPLAFAEPHKVSLMYARPGNEAVIGAERSEVVDALARADVQLRRLGPKFFQKNVTRQQEVLRSLLGIVEKTLPVPESMDKVMIRDAQTSQLLFRDAKEGALMTLTAQEGGQFSISGEVLGVTLADMVRNEEPVAYRSAEEFMTSDWGLCLVVQPHSTNFAPSQDTIDRDALVLLPLHQVGTEQISII